MMMNTLNSGHIDGLYFKKDETPPFLRNPILVKGGYNRGAIPWRMMKVRMQTHRL